MVHEKPISQDFQHTFYGEEYREYNTGDINGFISWKFLISVVVVVDSEKHRVQKYNAHDESVEPSIK